jgi:anthranilate 1,2-dioxygenase small subunit
MTDVYRLISQSQAEYARTIDNDNLEAWPDFFTDACMYRITSAQSLADGLEGGIVFCASKGMLADRISAMREANIFERHTYRHILGAPCILSEDSGRVESETPFLVARIMRTGETAVFATGKYLDSYVIADGKALIEKRIVVCDSSRVDTLLVIPL